MALHTKARLVVSIFAIIGLYSAMVQAGPEVKEKPHYTLIVKKIMTPINSNSNNISIFSLSSQHPLLDVQVADFGSLVPNKFNKKNSIFEFATKFNDKLQQLLAYFDFSSKSSTSNKEDLNQKDLNKKIQLNTENQTVF